MADIKKSLAQLKGRFDSLSFGQKLTFGVTALLSILFVVSILIWAYRPTYMPLYSGLSAEDAAEIVENLKAQKIPYRITAGGSTISVPEDKVYEVRLMLASKNLPAQSQGFEIFDQKTFGITEFQEHVNYQRALQGELERTISQLKSVEACRVHLVMPKENVFSDEKREASASVVVKLRRGQKLSPAEVEAITFLVSHSVEGLSPERVTVIDTEGRALSNPKKEQEQEMTAGLKLKVAMETKLEEDIKKLLEPVVGSGHVVAKVNVDLDWSKVETNEELFDPDKQVVRSEKIIEEMGNENSTESEPAPGTSSNLPQGQTQGLTGQKNSQTQSRTEIYNYEINRTLKKTIIPSGQLKRITAAVLVDGKYELKEGAKTATYVPRTEDEMKRISEMVKTAIGYDEKRGDRVEVANIPFLIETPEKIPSSTLKSPIVKLAIRYGLLAIAAIMMFLFVVRPIVAWLTSEQELKEEELQKVVGEMTGMTVAEAEKKLTEAREAHSGNELWSARMKELEERRLKMIENAKRDKKAIALMIKRWLKEDMT